MTTHIRKRIKGEAKILKEVLKKKKVSYAVVFAVPVVGLAVSAAWIAWDYLKHKTNGKSKEPV